MIFYKNDEVVVLTILRNYVVNWYHTHILHLDIERTEDAISQH